MQNNKDRIEEQDNIDTTGPSYTDYLIDKKEADKYLDNSEEESLQDLATTIGKLLEEKNKRYGNSVLEPLNIFAGKCKAGQRLDDKIMRCKNSDKLRTNDITDIIGYLIITLKEKGVTTGDIIKQLD